MNQNELVQYIAIDAEITQAEARRSLQSLAKAVRLTLRKNGNVALINIGTIYTTRTPIKWMRNPRTQEPIRIPAKKPAKLKAAQKLKDEIN